MKELKKLICCCLTACIVSLSVVGVTPALAADSDSESETDAESIDSFQEELKKLDEENKKYQKILEETESDIKKKEKYTVALTEKINVLDDKIVLINEEIDKKKDSISDKQEDIDEKNAEIDERLDVLCSRLRTVYMSSSATDLEIILGAKDFSDFIDKVQLVKTLSDYDENLIDEINVKLEAIVEQKEELESDKAELESEQDELVSNQNELNELLEENEELLEQLYKKDDTAKDKLEESQLKSEELEEKIIAYYKELAASSDTISSDDITASGFVWPCPGFYNLTSQWNENRGSYNHGAIDISDSGIMGSSVVATDDGIVVAAYNGCTHNWGKSGSCGCGGGYGNYLMIAHDNGKMTVYAHLTAGVVDVGDSVTKGQTIGYVGSTGESTGAHLHFECRLYGVKYNPMLEYED